MVALVTRGQERFNIYCSPCHDMTGSGKGMAVKHGMMAPPSFHQDRIRKMPDGQMFATISNGIRNMPSYGISVPIADRWAIVAYVRALQIEPGADRDGEGVGTVSSAEKTKKPAGAGDYRLPPGSAWAGAWKIAAGVGALGLAGSAGAWTMNPERFAYSYLFAFFLVLTIAFGSMFFILVERLTAASWSVSVRRTAEFFAAGTPIFALLFIPILFSMPTLYPWLHAGGEQGIESAAHAAQEPPVTSHGPGAPGPGPQMQPPPRGGPPGRPGMGHAPPPGGTPGMPGMSGDHGRPSGPPGVERGGERSNAAGEAEEAGILRRKEAPLAQQDRVDGARAPLLRRVEPSSRLTFFHMTRPSQDATKDPKLTLQAQRNSRRWRRCSSASRSRAPPSTG